MKNNLLLFLTILLLFACNTGGLRNENGILFQTDKIKGKYKLDLVDVFNEIHQPKEGETTGDQIARGIGRWMFSGTSIEFNFYENGKGVVASDLGFVKVLIGEKDINSEFEYELKQDSIIVLKNKANQSLNLVVRKFSDKFDYIGIFYPQINKEFVLKKVAE